MSGSEEPLWPRGVPPWDHPELVTAESDWIALLQEWQFTTQCFLYPIIRYGGEPQLAKYLTHRVVLHSAFVASARCVAFWDCLRDEIVETLCKTVPFILRSQEFEPQAQRIVNAFLAMNPIDQVVRMLYDYRGVELDPSTPSFWNGRFDAEELGALLGKRADAIRQAAARARTRHEKHYGGEVQ